MNRTATLLALILGFGLTAPAPAQERPSAYEHLKPLEWLIGDWVGDMTLDYDLPPLRKGTRVEYHNSYRWIMDRNYIVFDGFMVAKDDGRRVASDHEIISWDPVKKKLVHSIFGVNGRGAGMWDDAGPKPRLRWSGDLHAGGTMAGTSYLESRNAAMHTWQIRDFTLNGMKQDNQPLVTFKRKTGAAAGDL